ncbi:MAG: hypothetical protein QG628_306 [Patescibacteria group bacterium]|nr:hypothetical protein [Patescibacteria group bacterium]
MQPNQTYSPDPAPLPPEQNPYDFIMNSGEPQKKSPLGLPSGNSKLQRILIVGGGLVVLLIVGVLLLSMLTAGSKSNSEQLLTLAKTQTELIRIADLAVKEPSVRNESTRILAVNTSVSVNSTKQQVISMITKSGKKADPKQLALSKNTKTDAKLETALQNNQYDEVVTEELITELKNYRLQLKTSYDAVKSKQDKQVLSDAFKGTTLLLGNNTAN